MANETLQLIITADNREALKAIEDLAKSTSLVCNALQDKMFLREFLMEALFNNKEVDFLVIRDDTFLKDRKFRIFAREEVIEILCIKNFR